MTVIPANSSGLPPTESLFYAGWLNGNYRERTAATGGLLGIGGVYTGPWEDVSGYCEFRLVTYSDVGSAVGGILLQWSYDGVTVHATEAAATAVGLAVYDSGIIAYHYPYIRVQYTNGAAAQLVMFQVRIIVSPTAVGGGGGGAPIIGIVGQGAPGPVALAWPVELTAPRWSTPSPDPSSIAGALAAGKLEPDGALVTRGRVLTDEGSFADDFHGATLETALGGTCTFVGAGTAVVGVGTAFITAVWPAVPVRVGDYIKADAHADTAWTQVASVQDDTHLTLVQGYGGAGVAGAASSVSNYYRALVNAATIPVANSIAAFTLTGAAADSAVLLRRLNAGGRKATLPLRLLFVANLTARNANQNFNLGFYKLNAAGGLSPDSNGVYFRWDGAVNTVVICGTYSSVAGADTDELTITLPNVGTTAADHIYEILLTEEVVEFRIDGVIVQQQVMHLPDPYAQMALMIATGNTGATAGGVLNLNWLNVYPHNELMAEVRQSDATKLHVTAHGGELVQSLPSPNPSAILGTNAVDMQVEPDHALRTRGRVLTDENTFVDDFNGADVWTVLPGTITIAPGSTALVGTAAAIAALKAGDYIEVAADDLPATPAWTQIASIDSATTATLVTGYAGAAGGVAVVGRRSPWNIAYVGAGAVIATAAGEVGLLPALAAGAECTISRRLAFGGRKGYMPARMIIGSKIDAVRANQDNIFGFVDNTTYATITAGIWLKFQSTTQVRVFGAREGAVFSVDVTLPNSGVTSDEHKYELEIEPTLGASLWIDNVGPMSLGVGLTHMVDPYQNLYAVMMIVNTGVPALATNFIAGSFEIENIDLVEARITQPDGAKLHATIDAMPAVSVNVDLQGQVESLPAPNPSSRRSALADLALLEEPDHALRTRARVLTDEGAFNDDFNGADVWTVLPGTITIAPGSTALVGTAAAIAALKAGDYIEVAADDLPATPAWTQVLSIDSLTTGTLATGYAGAAGGVAVVGRRSPWIIQYTGAGAGIATAASVVTITPAPGAAGVAFLTRHVGVGNRKGFRPVRIMGNPALSAILPNQLGVFGFCNGPDVTAATAFASVRAESETTFRLTIYRDGFLDSYDYTLPSGVTSIGHIVELEWTNYGVTLWVDRVQALLNVGPHIADPYDELYAVFGVWNTGNPGGAATLTANVVLVESYNQLEAVVVQPDASKLTATVNERALAQSLPAPNPAAFLGTTTDSLQLEPDGALRTRARVLTDENSFAGDFPGASLYTAINGGMTLTPGSNLWARANLMTPLAVGDYVEITAEHSDILPVMEQIQTIDQGGLSGTLRGNYTGAVGGVLAAAQKSDWYVYCTAGGGDSIAVAGGNVALTLGNNAASRASLSRRLGPGGVKGCLPLLARFLLTLSNIRAGQQVGWGLASDYNAITGAITQLASFNSLAANTVNVNNYIDVATMLGNSKTVTLPDGGNITDATPHLFEVEALEDQVNWWINRYPVTGDNEIYNQGIVPTPYQEMYLIISITNGGAPPGGATTLTMYDAHCKSFDAVDARVIQPDAAKLNVTIGNKNDVNLYAIATYLPGWNNEFYGPTAALVAATPTLLMASPTGGYYAITVDPVPAAGERVRVLWSRPIPVTGVGYTGFTLTGPAQITVGGTIAPNISVGQFVYFTADGAAFAQLVTVVAPGAGLTVLTLGANYLGAAAPGLGSVCGVATATYPTVPPQSDGGSPVVYGPLKAQDVIILYADAAYAGGTVGAARSS